jgi:hypothetical protein
VVHGVGARLHRVEERVLLVERQCDVLCPLIGMLPLQVLDNEVGAERDRVELVGLARATLAIAQRDLPTVVLAEFATGRFDACAFLLCHFQAILVRVGALPHAARLCHKNREADTGSRAVLPRLFAQVRDSRSDRNS